MENSRLMRAILSFALLLSSTPLSAADARALFLARIPNSRLATYQERLAYPGRQVEPIRPVSFQVSSSPDLSRGVTGDFPYQMMEVTAETNGLDFSEMANPSRQR